MSDQFAHFVSGAGGGVVSMVLTYPLQNIATKLQVQKTDGVRHQPTLTELLKSEGILSFYSGISSGVLGTAISQGWFYFWYEYTKKIWEKSSSNNNLATWENLLIGAIAGSITAVLTNPIWVINTRASIQKPTDGKPKSTMEIFWEILKNEPQAFFNGIIPALILVANPSIQFMVFEKLKPVLEQRRVSSKQKLTDFDFFMLGLISKFIASTVTYPYILIKSRLQANSKQNEKSKKKTTTELLQEILQKEGVSGLFKGYKPKILQSILTSAFLFLAKERFFHFTITLFVLLGLRKKRLSK